jgi:hypothetical protein
MRQLLTSSLLSLCVASTVTAQSQDDPAKRLVGAWRLVSVEGTSAVFKFVFDHGLNPALRGRGNVRWFEFQGDDRVVLIPMENGNGGVITRKDATYKLTWERIK